MFTLNQLNTFKVVAELGSFNKAAELLYIAPNAVMKQINNLETELGTKLFTRSYRGQTLTEAGEKLFENANFILSYCDSTVATIKSLAEGSENVIRIGTTITAPIEIFNDIWMMIRKKHPDIKLEINTLNPESDRTVYNSIGQEVDLMIGSYDNLLLKSNTFSALEIMRVKPCAALSINHRLADKEEISFEDLHGENLLIGRAGRQQFIDEIRDYITAEHSEITLEEFGVYSMDLYNRCANSDDILLGTGSILRTHPLLKRIPIKWDKTSPYGIVYAICPTPAVENFVEIFKEAWIEKYGGIGFIV